MQAFNVYLNGELIDTVFFSLSDLSTEDDVYIALTGHDGYDPAIVVEEVPL